MKFHVNCPFDDLHEMSRIIFYKKLNKNKKKKKTKKKLDDPFRG